MINVPAQNEHPQLENGCEIVSLSMLLTAVGHPVDKTVLASELTYDPTPLVKNKNGQIVSWGNPNVGFVGSITNYSNGFGVYHGPIASLLNKIMPNQAVDLTGDPINEILGFVAAGRPVVMWTTFTFAPTTNWVSWSSPEGVVHTTLLEHAVLLVGYNQTTFFVNNPANGQQNEPVNRQNFIASWQSLGSQAVTVAK